MQIAHGGERDRREITAETGPACAATLIHASVLLEKVFLQLHFYEIEQNRCSLLGPD